ncbi:MAG: branched-chain-amino-acid transaminase [Actinomycetota bacterium]|nr:branched-chain-amino-acid transaminase [Actinomycetota bacterium]
MEEIVYLNGRLVPKREAKISIFDHGFLYGDGLFETMRSYNGRVFRLTEHIKRLFKSAKFLRLKLGVTEEEIETAVQETIKANDLLDAYVRLTISRGEGETGPDPSTCPKSTVVIIARPFRSYPHELYEKGARAIIANTRQDDLSPLARVKSMNFLNNILALMEAKAAGVDQAILLNTKGFVAEGAVGNIFIFRDNTLITPPKDAGILPGITRRLVLKLAKGLQIPIRVGNFPPDALMQAQECFLTNSLMEILPIVQVADHPIGTGRPGPVTQQLILAYRELVRIETRY